MGQNNAYKYYKPGVLPIINDILKTLYSWMWLTPDEKLIKPG